MIPSIIFSKPIFPYPNEPNFPWWFEDSEENEDFD